MSSLELIFFLMVRAPYSFLSDATQQGTTLCASTSTTAAAASVSRFAFSASRHCLQPPPGCSAQGAKGRTVAVDSARGRGAVGVTDCPILSGEKSVTRRESLLRRMKSGTVRSACPRKRKNGIFFAARSRSTSCCGSHGRRSVIGWCAGVRARRVQAF